MHDDPLHESLPRSAKSSPRGRKRVVLLCLLAQNSALGITYGSFGPLLASNELHFTVSRALASAGMGVVSLMVGLTSPLAGVVLQRISAHKALCTAALIGGAGYAGLALLSSYPLALAMYALIGMSISFLAVVGPVTLVSRWYSDRRGLVLGVINLPIFLFVSPFLVSALLPLGRETVLMGISAVLLGVAPLLLLIADTPRAGDAAIAAESDLPGRDGDAGRPPATLAQLARSSGFWAVTLAIGIMAGSGTALIVHLVPFGVERGLSLEKASGLVSIYAAAGIFGSVLLGWLADRIGAFVVLCLSMGVQAFLWLSLPHAGDAALFGIAALAGICSIPLAVLHAAALGEMFEPSTVGRAMGASYGAKLPFVFGFAPFLGWCFDHYGAYDIPFAIVSGIIFAAALALATFLVMRARLYPQSTLASL